MFIRWKGRYAYLERRYLLDGKVKSTSRYLGQNPLAALEKMVDASEIDRQEFNKLACYELEGILKPTEDGGLGIQSNSCGFLGNHKLAVFFSGNWLPGIVVKDKSSWFLKDDSGNIIGLCPGMKVRQLS
ncbi:MAG: hypothetical protein PHV03_10550 [Desulfitobacteriaceae bacterium]|nr:hypothetical protein [Desulfitobacteriaceae bacterium]